MPITWSNVPEDSDEEGEIGYPEFQRYQQTLMYGRYTRDLGKYAEEEGRRLKEEKLSHIEVSGLRSYRGRSTNRIFAVWHTLWEHSFARIGEDWVFLFVLGVSMAMVSFLMDFGIGMCNKARIWLYDDLATQIPFEYLAWVILPVFLILFSAGFSQLVAPQAVGSGIPEMKTILRGIVIKEYLTFKVFIAKVIGLTATLGSGLPLGKEGPFVHIASCMATLLSKAVTSFKGIYENESRNTEMLAAACAVGVACSFAAPIGGVLFSIEVTSSYFAVRNYWRGFFAAVSGAMTYRLLAVWFNYEETLSAMFKTSLQKDYPFDPQELLVFSTLGVCSGLIGAFFVYVHRRYVIFMRKNERMKIFLQKSRLLYPFLVTLLYSSLTFPPGFGQFVAGDLTTHSQVVELFSNVTWTQENFTVEEFEIVQHWQTPWTGVFVTLSFFMVFNFCGTVVASTLPVPSGIFVPVFKIGCALGRIFGEVMAMVFPKGLRYGGQNRAIIPGGYAVVGAAAVTGAVTHTISTSVIALEMTGQVTHILPVTIAVLIANGIAKLLQPSAFDSLIQIKKLPYLPDIVNVSSGAYNVYVEDFMVRNVKYIWYGMTYRDMSYVLKENRRIRSLPLVDSPDSMILLGSIQRTELLILLENHMGKQRRANLLKGWKENAQKKLEMELANKEKDEKEKQKKLIEECIKEWASRNSADSQKVEEARLAITKMVAPEIYISKASSGSTAETHSQDSTSIAEGNHVSPEEELSIATPLLQQSVVKEQFSDSENSIPTIDFCESKENEKDNGKGRRPSRFEVIRVDTPKAESAVTLQVDRIEINDLSEHRHQTTPPINGALPKKSILKKTHSFIMSNSNFSPFASPQPTPYATVHAGDHSRLKQTIETVVKRKSLKKSASSSYFPYMTKKQPGLPMDLLLERTMEEQRNWEEEELSKEVDFALCHIDPAPFQLPERTSLLKVHSLFSLLGLRHAYVTAIGRIIGVVALKELRRAVEASNAGEPPKSKNIGKKNRRKWWSMNSRPKRKVFHESNPEEVPEEKAQQDPDSPKSSEEIPLNNVKEEAKKNN